MTTPRSSGRAMLLGLCALFAIWVLVVPPFGGSDEFDHSYRAASAARGEWMVDPVAATRGTGAFLHVPNDIVEAAQPECQSLPYTHANDCVGTRVGDDRVIASGAARYHPLFYAVIGTPALPFHGIWALYAMRLTTALLTALFLGLAILACRAWATTSWPYVGVAAAFTPVAVYSSSIAAPNGVEMAAAIALWTSLIGLLRAPTEQTTRLAVVAGVSGATLATLRPLGPVWCLLVAAAVLVATRVEAGRIRGLLRHRVVLGAAALVLVSALQSVWWVLHVHALEIGVEGHLHTTVGHRLWVSFLQVPAWILQSIAAFPMRNDPGHPAVYACYLALFGLVLTLGLRAASGRGRLALGLVTAFVIGFPYASTVQSYNTYGAAWQGRYGLPLAVGLVLLAAAALDERGAECSARVRAVASPLFVVAQTLSIASVLLLEERHSPLAGTSSWPHPGLAVALVWAALASAAIAWGAFGARRLVPREVPQHVAA